MLKTFMLEVECYFMCCQQILRLKYNLRRHGTKRLIIQQFTFFCTHEGKNCLYFFFISFYFSLHASIGNKNQSFIPKILTSV